MKRIAYGAGPDSGAFWGGLNALNALILTGAAIALLMDDRRFLFESGLATVA
jgi:hypothetical protein